QRPLPMIYQSGYFTIKGYNRRRDTYLLDFPNEEVRSGMVAALSSDYFGDTSSPSTWLNDVSDSLEAGDLEKFKQVP
ncbi:MAG: AAA family ATPase, partial [Prevotella sp.]|nr:AAA family ATPase [Prevotella sp.]